MTDTTNGAKPNDTRREDFMAESRELGREMALGKDSLPKWAMKVARAAADGVISLQKNADGEDDITIAYTDLMKAASKKAIHEHTTGGLKANISKARQIATAAQKPTADFVTTLDKVAEVRLEKLAAKEKVKPAYAAFVDAARTQNEQDDDLTDEQISEVVLKPEPSEQTEEKILDRCAKALEDLVSGEKGIKSDSPLVEQAMGLVRERCAEIAMLRERAETIEKAVKLGLIPAPDTPPAAPLVDASEKAAIASTFTSNERAANSNKETSSTDAA